MSCLFSLPPPSLSDVYSPFGPQPRSRLGAAVANALAIGVLAAVHSLELRMLGCSSEPNVSSCRFQSLALVMVRMGVRHLIADDVRPLLPPF